MNSKIIIVIVVGLLKAIDAYQESNSHEQLIKQDKEILRTITVH